MKCIFVDEMDEGMLVCPKFRIQCIQYLFWEFLGLSVASSSSLSQYVIQVIEAHASFHFCSVDMLPMVDECQSS